MNGTIIDTSGVEEMKNEKNVTEQDEEQAAKNSVVEENFLVEENSVVVLESVLDRIVDSR